MRRRKLLSALFACAAAGCASTAGGPGGSPPWARRVPAEWEPAVAVLLGWPLSHPRELVLRIAERERVILVADDAPAADEARRSLAEWGVDAERSLVVVAAHGDANFAPRDWGPFSVFDESGALRLADGRYVDYPLSGTSCDGPVVWLKQIYPGIDFANDDVAPGAVAAALGIARIELPFAMTGGNVFSDGAGTAISTCILAQENELLGVPKARVLDDAQRLLGIERWLFVPNFEPRGVQHIDCVLKLLDEGRVLVKRTPADHRAFASVEKVAETIAATPSAHGRPYEVLRVDTPRYSGEDLANYTNALILNRRVFVPLFGIDADRTALETWRAAMPGYEVLGFRYTDPENPWDYTDALHCRTKAIFDAGMLHLRHRPPLRVAPAREHALEVAIRAYSRAGLVPDECVARWRLRGETSWRTAPLRPVGGERHAASMPGAPAGASVEYHFAAADRSGRRETLPRTAPDGFYAFTVDAAP